jgi:hypothetical protein
MSGPYKPLIDSQTSPQGREEQHPAYSPNDAPQSSAGRSNVSPSVAFVEPSANKSSAQGFRNTPAGFGSTPPGFGSTPTGFGNTPSSAPQTLSTLNEPVSETLKRDLKSIGEKLKIVLLPRGKTNVLRDCKECLLILIKGIYGDRFYSA